MRKKIVLVIIIVALVSLLVTIIFKFRDGRTNMNAIIEAIVVKVNENNLLVMEIENENKLYSVGLKNLKDIEFEKDQKILIHFSGEVQTTYPAELENIAKIEIKEEKSNIDIPDNILRYCYSSSKNIQVTINELTDSDIALTITDTNELPYKYAHSYKINKYAKNENYTGVGQKIGKDIENSTFGFTRYRDRIYMGRSA